MRRVIQWILIFGHREFQSPLMKRLSLPGGHPVAGLGELGRQERPRDTGGRKQERTLGARGTVIPPK